MFIFLQNVYLTTIVMVIIMPAILSHILVCVSKFVPNIVIIFLLCVNIDKYFAWFKLAQKRGSKLCNNITTLLSLPFSLGSFFVFNKISELKIYPQFRIFFLQTAKYFDIFSKSLKFFCSSSRSNFVLCHFFISSLYNILI